MRRRIRLDLNTKAEIAIQSAIHEVESCGGHPKLTQSIIHLQKALDNLSDYVDEEIDKCTLTKTP